MIARTHNGVGVRHKCRASMLMLHDQILIYWNVRTKTSAQIRSGTFQENLWNIERLQERRWQKFSHERRGERLRAVEKGIQQRKGWMSCHKLVDGALNWMGQTSTMWAGNRLDGVGIEAGQGPWSLEWCGRAYWRRREIVILRIVRIVIYHSALMWFCSAHVRVGYAELGARLRPHIETHPWLSARTSVGGGDWTPPPTAWWDMGGGWWWWWFRPV